MLPQVRYPGTSFLSGPSNAGLRLPARLRADLSLDPGQLPPGSALGPGSPVYYVLEDGAGVTAANATTAQRSATDAVLAQDGTSYALVQDVAWTHTAHGSYALRVWWFSAASHATAGSQVLAVSQWKDITVSTIARQSAGCTVTRFFPATENSRRNPLDALPPSPLSPNRCMQPTPPW